MTDLISYLFNIPIYPELANIIVSKLYKLDYTMLHFTSKELRKYTVGKVLGKTSIYMCAVRNGYLNVLKWLRENDVRYEYNPACIVAAKNGYLDILKWLREDGCPWDEDTCSGAAEYGRFDVLKWLRENGCPWNEWTCYSLAQFDHLDVLKWARENGCPWNEYTKRLAAEKGYVE